MTAYLLLFGGAFITFALIVGWVGPGVTDAAWRWAAGAGGAAVWIALQGVLNGLRVRRTLPSMKAVSAEVAKHLTAYSAGTLGRAVERGRAVLVQFFSEHDPDSLRAAAMLAQAGLVLEGRAQVGRLDVDRHPDGLERFGVAKVPTVLIFTEGHERARLEGDLPPARLRKAIEQHL